MNGRNRGRGPQRPPAVQRTQPQKQEETSSFVPKYTVGLPYPPLDGILQSAQNARLLSTMFAGVHGELTACAQYVQHGLVLRQMGAKGADLLQGVAAAEMYHLRLIGEMLLKCGGKAAYYDWQRKMAWNGKMVKYAYREGEIWRFDLASERESISGYQWVRERVNDLCMVQVIDRILLDERFHLDLFQEAAGQVDPTQR